MSHLDHRTFQLLTDSSKRCQACLTPQIVTPINRTSETLLWERKNPLVCYRFGEVTLAGVPSPLHLLVSKTGFLLSILLIQVNKGMGMIATLAELDCFACDMGEGGTTVMAVLT